MARLLEDDAKGLVAAAGLNIPRSETVAKPEESKRFAGTVGIPVVLKALVPVGGRQKLGAVRNAKTPEEAETEARNLLGSSFHGFRTKKILVEEQISILKELYVSIMNDSRSRQPLLLLGLRGGVDVESESKSRGSLVQHFVDPCSRLERYECRRLWLKLGVERKLVNDLAEVLYRLYTLFLELDAVLLEVNPLALTTDGKIVIVSCVIDVDDDSIYRHPELRSKTILGLDRTWKPLTEREERVVRADLEEPYQGTIRYTEFEGGDIGFLCGGGGGSLVLQDAIRAFGGEPANYSEWGGNPTEAKMMALTRTVISKPGIKGLLICLNISNNTRTDVAAKAIAEVLRGSNINPKTFPVVVRLPGIGDELARAAIEGAGFEYHGEDITMEEAAALIVSKVKEVSLVK